MLHRFPQVVAYLDDHWPLLWMETQGWGLCLSDDWRRRPYRDVFDLLRETGRCPPDWECDLSVVLRNQDLADLARRSGITKRHLLRLRKGSVSSCGETRPVNPRCITYCKVMCALGRSLPLVRLANEKFRIPGRLDWNRKVEFPDVPSSRKTYKHLERRGRPRHPFLRNDRTPWHKVRSRRGSPRLAPQPPQATPQVAPQPGQVVPQVAPQTGQVVAEVAPQPPQVSAQPRQVAPPRSHASPPRHQVARPQRRRDAARRTTSMGAGAQSQKHASRKQRRSKMCPKGHVLSAGRVVIATAKKRTISTLTSEIFRYASAVELCRDDGDEMKSKDDMRAALDEAVATAPGGLDRVFAVLGQLMERSEERQVQLMERSEERQVQLMERSEERHREAMERAEERHSERAKRSSELTLDLFGKLSTRFDDRCDRLEQKMMMLPAAEATPQTTVEKVVKDLADVATAALRKYVSG